MAMSAGIEYVQIRFTSPADVQHTPRVLYPTRCGGWAKLAPREVSARAGRLFLAAICGAVGAALGAAIYYAVLAFTGKQIGFVAVIVGLLVGKGVNFGSGGRGGFRYQLIAIGLTYCAIVTTYIPFILNEAGSMTQRHLLEGRIGTLDDPVDYEAVRADVTERPTGAATTVSRAAASASGNVIRHVADWFAQGPQQLRVAGGFVVIFLIAATSPMLAATNNFLTLLIISFAIWEAWKINRRHATIVSAGPSV
jgi:hypothetical protein